MLDSVSDLPPGVLGLTATGTVIAQDVAQALNLLRGDAYGAGGLVVFVDADFDGYLSELVAGLGEASGVDKPLFGRWALVLPDDMVAEATQLGGAGKVSVFPRSRRADALAWVAASA
jgi:hypothetical protein